MKEETGWDSFCRQCWFQTILFVALSFVEYVIIEAFLDGDIVSIGLEYSIKNIMLLMGVNLIIVSLTRWLRFTFLLSGVFVLILGMANYFVDAFRGYGIVYMDIYAVKTAANVAGEYKYLSAAMAWPGPGTCFYCAVCGDHAIPFTREKHPAGNCFGVGSGSRCCLFCMDQSGAGFFW